jgi:hypothetical protein
MNNFYLIAYYTEDSGFSYAVLENGQNSTMAGTGINSLERLSKVIEGSKEYIPQDIPVSVINMVPEGSKGRRLSGSSERDLSRILLEKQD